MLNCQIVLCPGLNDGDELKRTLTDLGSLMPNIQSTAIVPVGLSKYREKLYPLERFNKKTASDTIDIIEHFQSIFLEKYGTRMCFPSDEFYLIAERPIPPTEFYEDYPQFENGVGMLRSLADEFYANMDYYEDDTFKDRRCSVATGYSPYEFICSLADDVSKKMG